MGFAGGAVDSHPSSRRVLAGDGGAGGHGGRGGDGGGGDDRGGGGDGCGSSQGNPYTAEGGFLTRDWPFRVPVTSG